jgi:hypothetical protein
MQALALVDFEGWFLCKALPAFGTGVFVDGAIGGYIAKYV